MVNQTRPYVKEDARQQQQRLMSRTSSPNIKKKYDNRVASLDSPSSPRGVSEFEAWEEDPKKPLSRSSKITMRPVVKARTAAFEGSPKRSNKAAFSRASLRNSRISMGDNWGRKETFRKVQMFPPDVSSLTSPRKEHASTKLRQLQESLRQQLKPAEHERVLPFKPSFECANKAVHSRAMLRNDCISGGDDWGQKETIRRLHTFPSDVSSPDPAHKETDPTKLQQPPLLESLQQLEPAEPTQEEEHCSLDPAEISVCSSVTTPTLFSAASSPTTIPNGESQDDTPVHTSCKSVRINPCIISYKVFDRKTAASKVGVAKEATVVDLEIDVANEEDALSEHCRGSPHSNGMDVVAAPPLTSYEIDRGVAKLPTLPLSFSTGDILLSPPQQGVDQYEAELTSLLDGKSNPNKKKKRNKKNALKRVLKEAIAQSSSRRQRMYLSYQKKNEEELTQNLEDEVQQLQQARAQIETDQQECRRVHYLRYKAAALIQASARRYLVRLWKLRVDKLRRHLVFIDQQCAQELHDIESWKHEKMARIPREVEQEVREQSLSELESKAPACMKTIEELRRENTELRKEQRELQLGYNELVEANRLESIITSTLTCGMECSAISAVVLQSNQVLESMEEDYKESIAHTERMRDEMCRLCQIEKAMNAILKKTLSQIKKHVRVNIGLDHAEMFPEVAEAASQIPIEAKQVPSSTTMAHCDETVSALTEESTASLSLSTVPDPQQ